MTLMQTRSGGSLGSRIGARPGLPPDARVHSLNDQLAIGLLVILIASPIALGSYGGTFWTISAGAVGLVGIWYWARMTFIDAAPRVPLSMFWPETILFLAFCLALFGQTLPLPFDTAFVAPDGTTVTSPSLSLAPDDTWLMLTRQVGYATFWFLFLQVGRNGRRAGTVLLVIFGMIVAHAGYSLFSLTQLGDTLLGIPKTAYAGFATGTFVNRNSFATFLACGMAIGTALLLGSLVLKREGVVWQAWAERVALVVGLGFIGAALLATGSRMGVVAGTAGAAVVIFLAAIVRPARVVLLTAVVIVLAGIAVLIGYSGSLVDRVFGLIGASEARGPLYAQILEMIMARPWGGYGGGSFAAVFPTFQHPPLDGGLVWELGHSTYLSLWAELGVIAGSLPMLIVLLLAGRILMSLRDHGNFVMALAALGSIAAFAVHATVDFSLEIQANTYLFVAMLALGASGYAATRKRAP